MLATGGSAAAAIGFMKDYGCTSIKLMVLLAQDRQLVGHQRVADDMNLVAIHETAPLFSSASLLFFFVYKEEKKQKKKNFLSAKLRFALHLCQALPLRLTQPEVRGPDRLGTHRPLQKQRPGARGHGRHRRGGGAGVLYGPAHRHRGGEGSPGLRRAPRRSPRASVSSTPRDRYSIGLPSLSVIPYVPLLFHRCSPFSGFFSILRLVR